MKGFNSCCNLMEYISTNKIGSSSECNMNIKEFYDFSKMEIVRAVGLFNFY